jgi:hypothetical protein
VPLLEPVPDKRNVANIVETVLRCGEGAFLSHRAKESNSNAMLETLVMNSTPGKIKSEIKRQPLLFE